MTEKNQYLPLPTTDAGAPTPAAASRSDNDVSKKIKFGLPAVVLFLLLSALGAGFVSCRGDGKNMDMDAMHKSMNGDNSHGHMGMMGGMMGSMGATLASAINKAKGKAACPAQPAPLLIGDDWDPASDEAYAHLAATRLSEAVKIDTVSSDDMPDDAADPRWDNHYPFAEWMEKTYPAVYGKLEHEVVNTHAHLFTWKASGEYKKKPILLMAHEDTVPVNPATVDQWTYPPWSGEITRDATPETPGTWIWGRGSSDCKNSLTGILGAVEKLVQDGFAPDRDVLIAYGFDEEVSFRNRASSTWWRDPGV
jgi:Gly-Xaa carboxypeptidase